MPRGRPRRAVRGTLGTVASVFTERLRLKTPPTPPEAIEALADSKFWCEPCRARFGNKKSYDLHRKDYHIPEGKIKHKHVNIDGPDYEDVVT